MRRFLWLAALFAVAGIARADTTISGPITFSTGLTVTGSRVQVSNQAITPGAYTSTNLTVNQQGIITAIASGSVPASCSGIAAGAVLYSDGATCVGDIDHFYWTLPSVSNPAFLTINNADTVTTGPDGGIGLDMVAGNDSAGGAIRLRQSAGGGSLRMGFVDGTAFYGYVDAKEADGDPQRLVFNSGGGKVVVGTTADGFVGQPQDGTLHVNVAAVSRWWLPMGASNAFRGGLFSDSESSANLSLWNGNSGTETALISANTATRSKVPGGFTAAGLRDSTVTTCNGANDAIQTDADGDLVCGAITGGGGVSIGGSTNDIMYKSGAAALSGVTLTDGQLAIGRTGNSPLAANISAGSGISVTNGAGSISIATTGGASGGNGLWQPIMSATTTSANTGLTTWLNQGSASVTDSSVGVSITAPIIAANNLKGRCKASPSTPYTITALVAYTAIPNSGNIGGIGWYDGTNKLTTISVRTTSGVSLETINWNTPTSISGTLGTTILVSGWPYWFRLADDGTNFTLSWSNDGVNFITHATGTKAGGFLGSSGYSNVCLWSQASTASAGYTTLLSWVQQ